MGSSSKKHKDKDRESKKKRKHRSRSRSKERERKRRHRDNDEDVSSSRRREDEREREDKRSSHNADNVEVFDYDHGGSGRESSKQREKEPESQVSGDGSSLSIEETNRLRAKLGLKPLDQPSTTGGEDTKDSDNSVHAPAINMGQQRKTERLKEKMSTMKSKRVVESKLSKVKTLGDSDSDDDGASAWVQRSRKLQKEREMAEKRAKMLAEMDEDFGIGNLVEEEFKKDTAPAYTSRHLTGLKVEHSLEKFAEGRNVVLTLKDKGILDEDEEGDVLVNVNIEDDERAEKNIENKKKKPDYKPYDEPEYDEYGILKPTNMLEKYDEEIEGVKKDSFTLGSGGHYDAAHEKRMTEIRRELKAQQQTLSMPAPNLVAEYLTKEEMEKFKKPKKKVRKIRKKEKALKADDLLPLPDADISNDYGSRSRGRGRLDVKEEGEVEDIKEEAMDTSDPAQPNSSNNSAMTESLKQELDDSDLVGPDEDLTGVAVEEEEMQNELNSVLAKTRKLKQKKERKNPAELLNQLTPSGSGEAASGAGVNIILNSTSEFCRNLGEIPTYGLAGNREEDRDELLDMELELIEQRRREEEQEETTGGWNEVDIDENPVDIQAEEASVLEEEPIATDGIGAALKLAMKKGYLEAEDKKKSASMSKTYLELKAQNYTIQDKRYDDLDEKNRKRERYSGGMVTDFKEKDSYKPDVKLDYVDESGRNLNPKEAFRQLSHRFHGKGSGKKKTEKRGKKVEEELLMKQMSSTDTPLNTLSLLQDKQRSEKSPFIVLSGSKGFTSSNSISKPS